MVEAASLSSVPEVPLNPDALDAYLATAAMPVVMRGLASGWPLVAAARKSAQDARDYLARHARNRSFPASQGQPGGDDRLFYGTDMAMNFHMANAPLADWLSTMARAEADPAAPVLYLSSIDMHHYFEGLAEANALPLGDRQPIASIWIGTRTCIAAHNDVPHNVAVCVAGRRRFTLFPPEHFDNLYLGPLENTPAGRPVSMVDMRRPDLDAHPRFAAARAEALVADLEPGDALYIPSLWWHHVEGLAPFNILVNYWWRDTPRFLGNPEDALLHAILAVRDLPDTERQHWRALFDHYVFGNGPEVSAHLPAEARGILAPLTAATAGQLRARLLRGLSR